MILRVLTTKHGWIDLKNLTKDTEVYSVKFDGKNKELTTSVVENTRRVCGELFCYFNDQYNGYAFEETKVFNGNNPIKEVLFSDLIHRYSVFNFLFNISLNDFSYDFVNKSEKEMKEGLEKRILGGWAKRLSFKSSVYYLDMWKKKYENLFVYSDKEISDMQTIMLRCCRLGKMFKTSKGKMFVDKISYDQICTKIESMGNFDYNLPIDEKGNLLHLIVRDDEQRISIF